MAKKPRPTILSASEAAALKSRRQAMHVSAAFLAGLVGISNSCLSSYERRHRQPTPDALEAWKAALRRLEEQYTEPKPRVHAWGPGGPVVASVPREPAVEVGSFEDDSKVTLSKRKLQFILGALEEASDAVRGLLP